jgi:hypothetical protein
LRDSRFSANARKVAEVTLPAMTPSDDILIRDRRGTGDQRRRDVDGEVRIGLCGFTMAFEDYVREYRLVEVQQTFYEPPRDGTIRRWRAATPGVRVGQRVYSPGLGWLTIDGVEPVDLEALADADARADGFETAAGLRDVLLSLYPDHAGDGKWWFRVSFQVATLTPARPRRVEAKAAGTRRRRGLHNHPELF